MNLRRVPAALLALACVGALGGTLYARHPATEAIGQPIAQETARVITQAYEEKYPALARGHLYGKEALRELLAIPGMAGVYLFHAQDDDGTERLVLRAADTHGALIRTSTAYDRSVTCPPKCPGMTAPLIADIGGPIADDVAERWIANAHRARPQRPISQLFGRALLEKILDQPGVEGIYLANSLHRDGV